jgi:hypothetical protein
MDIIENIVSTDIASVFKAPKNKIFLVNSITLIELVTVAGCWIGVVNDAKPENESTDPRDYAERCLLLCNSNNLAGDGIVRIDYPKPHETKYISIFSLGISTGRFWIIINLDLKKATQNDLIWEFLKKTKT